VPDKAGEAGRKIRIRFEAKGTVYDVRGKTIAGTGTEFETTIDPAIRAYSP